MILVHGDAASRQEQDYIARLQDASDIYGTPVDGYAITWDSSIGMFVFAPASGGGGTPGGSDTYVQFNNAGTLGGDSGFSYSGSGVATLTGRLNTPIVRAVTDGTAGIKFQNAAGSIDVVKIDTTNFTTNFYSSGTQAAVRIRNENHNSYLLECYNLTFSSSSIFQYYAGNTGGFWMGTSGTSKLHFYTSGYSNIRMTIDTAGNVGIGNPSPANKLDVAGTIQMDGLRIDVTPASETVICTHTITFSANGTNYKIPCVPA